MAEQITSSIRELPEVIYPFEVFTALRKDVEKPVSQVRSHRKSRIVSGVLQGLSARGGKAGQAEELDASGSRLAAIMGNDEARAFSEKLAVDPTNSLVRMGLIQFFLDNFRKDDLVAARDAYLLSLVELDGDVLTLQAIRVAGQAQIRYFASLYAFFKRDLMRLQSGASDAMIKEQVKRTKSGVSFIQECAQLLRVPQEENDYELNTRELLLSGKILFGDIKYGVDPMLKALALIPPAEKARRSIMDSMQRLERNNPLTGYHDARILEIQARLSILRGSLSQDEVAKNESLRSASMAVAAIRRAMKKVGATPRQPVEIAIIFKFGQLCQMKSATYRLFKMPLPDEHKAMMKEAVERLRPISNQAGVAQLQSRLAKEMNG